MTGLGELESTNTATGFSIDNAGQVTGYSCRTFRTGPCYAFLYGDGQMTNLSTLSNGSLSYGYSLMTVAK